MRWLTDLSLGTANLKSFANETLILTASGRDFNCELWSSKVEVTLKRNTSYVFSAKCHKYNDHYAIVIWSELPEFTVTTGAVAGIVVGVVVVILVSVFFFCRKSKTVSDYSLRDEGQEDMEP